MEEKRTEAQATEAFDEGSKKSADGKMKKFSFVNPFKLDGASLKEKGLLGLKEGLIPTLIQFVILVLVILEFNYLIGPKNGVALVQDSRLVGGSETNPNIVRLVYLFLSFAAAFVCAFFAEKQDRAGKEASAFWLGLVGGILLWQSIGECSWHFGFSVGEHFVGFPCIEGASGTFVILPLTILLVYAYKRGAFGWGVWIFILSFMLNWLGHFLMEGTYPWFASLCTEETWLMISGLVFGIPAIIFPCYTMFVAAEDKKGRLLSSLMLYTGLGIVASGVLGL